MSAANPGLDVVCVGAILADIFTSPLPRLPNAGELVVADELVPKTGGNAANAATDLVTLGAKVAIVGKVGNDAFGDLVRRDLESKGLDVSSIRTSPNAPTSLTAVLLVAGEDRRFIHCFGANAELSIDDVDLDLVARARALHFGGFGLVPGFDQYSAARLFRFARERGIMTILDVAGVMPERGLDAFREVLPLTDVFLPNDDEARGITGVADPTRQAGILGEAGVGIAAVTMGPRGAIVRTRTRCLRAPAFNVDVVDPTGSGDAFDAGFIYGLLQGWDLRGTLEFASAIGASACTRLGCTAGVFDLAQAQTFLSQNHLDIASS